MNFTNVSCVPVCFHKGVNFIKIRRHLRRFQQEFDFCYYIYLILLRPWAIRDRTINNFVKGCGEMDDVVITVQFLGALITSRDAQTKLDLENFFWRIHGSCQ